ncbi:type III secretion system export apparatus subunit SctS [Pantoea agglomerans]|jgi:type III secretion protein S|uniref:EscS/YscS/HrcS family type III secretion system export apparatus protein n=1 Tax=Enterobacter agglomerans TaxID=549 RepID=A0A0D5A0I5_ENTAG|nr:MULTISPECIES: type III secretion system export apparatus subunit SctS [Pantoea]MDF2625805.1 EscS/YscS/HrcS family type secretion system export apparatus protein [Kosakonia cowanii]AJW29671.1 type III secretion system protein [Pantoea agglomerans]AOE41036.1 EscS/YscS/HrcS family type III secretion system export apparatus protein [Pantoea agglomerans]AZI50796.1 EscS/YscS/HrcS family type III secretion system export apparatus protein [Pantoea agglomerans]KAF6639533.1 type III secretion system 
MDILTLFRQGLLLVVILSAPPLLVAVISGVIISLVQAAMQLQDQTLPFCIKLIAVGLTLALTGRWVGVELMELAQAAFAMMSTVSS